MELGNFIFESNRAECSESLADLFLEFLKKFDIDQFILVDFCNTNACVKNCCIDVLACYPPDICEKNRTCPEQIYRRLRASESPFFLDRNVMDRGTPELVPVADGTPSGEYCAGIGVPIHQPLGKIAGMGFASAEKKISCGMNSVSLLHAASIHFYAVYTKLSGTEKTRGNEAALTQRESEVLQWIARGKSKHEIAALLNISESGIKRHCESIFLKLEVKTLASAVAKALKLGLINYYIFLAAALNPVLKGFIEQLSALKNIFYI